MKVSRVISFRVKKNHSDYPFIRKGMMDSRLLYNLLNFVIKQRIFKYSCESKSQSYIGDVEHILEGKLESQIRDYLSDGNMFNNYLFVIGRIYMNMIGAVLNSKQIQSIIRILIRDWKSYFRLKKQDSHTRFPKKKDKYCIVESNNQTISRTKLKDGVICVSGMQEGFYIPKKYSLFDIKSVRLLPKQGEFVVEVIYEKEIEEKETQFDPKHRSLGIDIGLNCLFTLSYNFNKRGNVISGKYIKSLNRLYNKSKAKHQSRLSGNIRWSKKLELMTRKRNLSIRNEIGRVTNMVVSVVKENRIDQVVIGYNPNFKKIKSASKTHNQNFTMFPFRRLLDVLKYKLEEIGVNYIEIDESYTSKASFLSKDAIPTYGDEVNSKQFSGTRTKRSYKDTKLGTEIHSDLNASYNILRKAGVEFLEEITSLDRKKVIYPLGCKK